MVRSAHPYNPLAWRGEGKAGSDIGAGLTNEQLKDYFFVILSAAKNLSL